MLWNIFYSGSFKVKVKVIDVDIRKKLYELFNTCDHQIQKWCYLLQYIHFLEDFKFSMILIKKMFIIVSVSFSFVLIKLFSNKMIFSEFGSPWTKWDLKLFQNFLLSVTSLISKLLYIILFLFHIRVWHSNYDGFYMCTNFLGFCFY